MKAKFNAQSRTLQELPGMKEPYPVGISMEEYKEYVNAYKEHITSLRTIPCDPSCSTVWKEGQEVVEGVDFWISGECNSVSEGCNRYSSCEHCTLTAIPIQQVSEDDLWREVLDIAVSQLSDGDRAVMNYDSAIGELKEKYSIKKK
jgi:hypothetical protein